MHVCCPVWCSLLLFMEITAINVHAVHTSLSFRCLQMHKIFKNTWQELQNTHVWCACMPQVWIELYRTCSFWNHHRFSWLSDNYNGHCPILVRHLFNYPWLSSLSNLNWSSTLVIKLLNIILSEILNVVITIIFLQAVNCMACPL